MVNKHSHGSSHLFSYRTRSSLGVAPKKRQSYGDFIEHPVAKRRLSAAGLSSIQRKIERYPTDDAPELKRDLNGDYIVLRECFVKLEKLSGKLLDSQVKSDDIQSTDVSRKKCAVDGCDSYQGQRIEDDLFELPEKTSLRKQWLKFLKKKWVPGLMVCSKHFEQSDFSTIAGAVKPALKDGAIPRKFNLEKGTKKSSDKTIENVIHELLTKNLVDKEGYRDLEPYKDLTLKEIESQEPDGNYCRVQKFIDAVHSCSDEAYNFLRKAISLPNFERSPSTCSSAAYRSALHDLFPYSKNIDTVNTSADLVDVLVHAKLLLEGVRTLVVNNADFHLSCLDQYENEKIWKEKVETFSKIVFLNSPQMFHKIKGPLHLPDVLTLFPSLFGPNDVSLESLTLGQLMNEASKSYCVPEESIRNLIPFGGCQLCPFSTSTLKMYSHVISAIYFNAPEFFNFLAQYLPLPNVVLIPNSATSKECDSTADKEEHQIKDPPSSQTVCGAPPSSNQKNEPWNERQVERTPSEGCDNPVSSATPNKLDVFVRGVCPKTGKNVAKLDVDTEGFLPKDLIVKVVGHILTINGCREESGQKVDFMKTITLPNYVDADQAGCYYFKGKMSIHAPFLEGSNESDDQLSSSTNATNVSSELMPTIEKNKVEKTDVHVTLHDEDGLTAQCANILEQKQAMSLPKSTPVSSDDDIPRNVAVLMNVDDQEYVSLIVEVSKLFKPSEIVVKVRENKTISITGETRSSDPQTKSRLYAVIEREFDLPKKIERTTLKAGCSGDGLLKIFAKVASNQNGH